MPFSRFPIIVPVILLAACSAAMSTEERMQEVIDDANYCETATDCVDVGAICPFGCNILVNSADADDVSAVLSSYQSDCVYSCLAIGGLDCVNNECVTLPFPE